jgi:2-phospho-L-lactate guanylyltransferase (CobY/MobA/RfbA family)
MQPLILIPCKSFAAGKSRLSSVLSPERRDRLCRSFLVNTVHLAADLVGKGHIYVVGSNSEVAALAFDLGVGCEGEADIDLNSALTCSIARILEREPQNSSRNILILPIDLVRSSPTAIAPVIAAQADAVVVPDRLEQGTNLLRLRGDPPSRGSKLSSVGSVAHDRSLVVRKHARHRSQIADVSVDDAKQRDNGGLVGGDRIEIAHGGS